MANNTFEITPEVLKALNALKSAPEVMSAIADGNFDALSDAAKNAAAYRNITRKMVDPENTSARDEILSASQRLAALVHDHIEEKFGRERDDVSARTVTVPTDYGTLTVRLTV